MKRYQGIFTLEALADAQAAAAYIAAAAPWNAQRWYDKLLKATQTLAVFPNRCPKAPEATTLNDPRLRQLIFGNYRIIFLVEDDIVHIIHVRHGARRPAGQELEDPA